MSTTSSRKPQRPEILAPAGDEECLRAAIAAGADAVYFGLANGFNARARAQNFTLDRLPETFDLLHRHAVKGYVAFNTLVWDDELAHAEKSLRAIARAGADAIIVQDLGVARLAHELAPELPIHASTQMTVSSPEGAAIARELGVVRVVLPRELNVDEIRRFRQRSDLELECFVHGALCVSWSGQCLTSEAWGQRSANRGQCAQACRLPYELLVDDRVRALGLEKYLLSPKDLAAYALLPELADAGVSCFKIEGRYKGPEYVVATVEKYRRVLDAWAEGRRETLDQGDVDELALTFSRGFSNGWLAGDDHQELSHGLYPGHRGLRIGTVEKVRGLRVWVRPDAGAPAVKAGDWMLFDGGDPEQDEVRGGVYAVEPESGGLVEVRFGSPGPDLTRVHPGHILWKSHDSALKRRLLRKAEDVRRVPIDLQVQGSEGAPLEVSARDAFGRTATERTDAVLEPARGAPLDADILQSKLGAFGGTQYELRELDVALEGALALAPAELKRVRRRLVETLEAQPRPVQSHAVHAVDRATLLPTPAAISRDSITDSTTNVTLDAQLPRLIPLCRTLEQVDAALDFGADEIELDFMELVGLGEAVERCRERGARILIATPRVQKPGEEPFDKRFEKLRPDGILARHLGALQHYRGRTDMTLHGDFSLNAANALTAKSLFALGIDTLTPAYDLNLKQVEKLVDELPAARLEITLHQHLPLYHTEYCLYAHHLSDGKDYRTCGRPCEEHRVKLRDKKGYEHPVLVDVGCRNTVFNAQAQSAAPNVQRLADRGVRRFRVELVWESGEETTRVLRAYRSLLEGRIGAQQVVRELGAVERYGVTSGTLTVINA